MVVRPEFDVTLAYNPASILVPIARVEGIGFSMLGADSVLGSSIVGGQGGIVRLDGSPDPIGPRALFLKLGADGADLSGKSRAAQWMLLDQMIDEVRGLLDQYAQWVRESPSLLAFPSLLFIHTLGMALVAGGSAVISMALLGLWPRTAIKPLERLYPVMWCGFWIT